MACYCCISQAHAYNITNSEFIFTLSSLLLLFSSGSTSSFYVFFSGSVSVSSYSSYSRDFCRFCIAVIFYFSLTRSPQQLISLTVSHSYSLYFSGISKLATHSTAMLCYAMLYSPSLVSFLIRFGHCADSKVSGYIRVYPLYGSRLCFLLFPLSHTHTHTHCHMHALARSSYTGYTHTHTHSSTGSLNILMLANTPGMFCIHYT